MHAVPCTRTPDGTLLVPVNAHHRYVADARSIAQLRNALLWLLRSDDGGVHMSAPMLVTDACNGIRTGLETPAQIKWWV